MIAKLLVMFALYISRCIAGIMVMYWYSVKHDARDSRADLDCWRCWCSVINECEAVSAVTVAEPGLILIDVV